MVTLDLKTLLQLNHLYVFIHLQQIELIQVSSTNVLISYTETYLDLRFFNYRSFEGVEAPEGCENVA